MIGDHFKYKDKQAHLERSNVVHKLKCSCGNSYIGQTQRNLKFRLDEHNPLKSNRQATDVVKHLYTYPDHFMDFKNPEILASAFNYRELLIKETLLIQEQQPEIMWTIFPPLYNSSIRRFYVKWSVVSSYVNTYCVHYCWC